MESIHALMGESGVDPDNLYNYLQHDVVWALDKSILEDVYAKIKLRDSTWQPAGVWAMDSEDPAISTLLNEDRLKKFMLICPADPEEPSTYNRNISNAMAEAYVSMITRFKDISYGLTFMERELNDNAPTAKCVWIEDPDEMGTKMNYVSVKTTYESRRYTTWSEPIPGVRNWSIGHVGLGVHMWVVVLERIPPPNQLNYRHFRKYVMWIPTLIPDSPIYASVLNRTYKHWVMIRMKHLWKIISLMPKVNGDFNLVYHIMHHFRFNPKMIELKIPMVASELHSVFNTYTQHHPREIVLHHERSQHPLLTRFKHPLLATN